MKLSRDDLFYIFECADDPDQCVRGGLDMDDVNNALIEGTLEIEGYVRADHIADDSKKGWIKFDPNDPKTFPKDDESVLVYYDGEIVWLEAHVCDGYCTFFSPEWTPKMKHITHWRPLPTPPQETEENGNGSC